MKTIILKSVLFLAVVSIIAACKKDDNDPVVTPPNPNEEELITTFTILFTDPNGINPDVTATFRDLDGPGGNAPTAFDTIHLIANSTYNASISLLNEAANPAEDITEEVEEEGDEHLFCYEVSSGLNASIIRTDSDGTYEIGLLTQWTVSSVSQGEVTMRLKHQPGIKNGSCDPGETDIELNFQTIIE